MKILLPFDGSEVALEAVRFAVRLGADGLAISVVLANVQEPASLYELMVAHDPRVIEQVSAAAGANTSAGCTVAAG
jgi:nucleotide-binding universal stress UspA family protein